MLHQYLVMQGKRQQVLGVNSDDSNRSGEVRQRSTQRGTRHTAAHKAAADQGSPTLPPPARAGSCRRRTIAAQRGCARTRSQSSREPRTRPAIGRNSGSMGSSDDNGFGTEMTTELRGTVASQRGRERTLQAVSWAGGGSQRRLANVTTNLRQLEDVLLAVNDFEASARNPHAHVACGLGGRCTN